MGDPSTGDAVSQARRVSSSVVRSTLSRGGFANPDVLLVDTSEGPRVVKDYSPRSSCVRRWLAPWLVRRELATYRVLAEHPHVPAALGCEGPIRLLLEYRPGEPLTRSLRGKLSPSFLSELRAGLAAMHAAGVVHLDLRHRSNVLAGADGHPVLIDFASSIRFQPGSLAARWLLPWLAAIDARALRKWERKLGSAETVD